MAFATEQGGRAAHVVRIDGTALTGRWLGADADAIRVEADGREQRLLVDELSSVRFETAPASPAGSVIVHLGDGGSLYGEIVGGEGDAILLKTLVAGSLRLSFRDLAGIRFVQGDEHAPSAELFDAALQDRLPGQDVLITRGPEDVKSLRGRLESLDAERGTFEFAERSRTFQNEKLYGIVFAAGVAKPVFHPLLVELADGSSFAGQLEAADTATARLRASFGATLDLAAAHVARFVVRSPRVVYLSDLKPTAERTDGLIHRPSPMRRDRNVAAGPLSLGGRVFDKGLGVHSRTEVTFDVGGEFQFFVATIGIDDVVRPRGCVVFRVIGDGQELFHSGEIRGADDPRDVRLDISGVRSLTLSVDYGDGLDVADYADWGGARVLRPLAAGKERRQ